MRANSPSRVDVAVAAAFVLAAAVEAVLVHRSDPGLMTMGLFGAPVLGSLAVRRTRPVLCLVLIIGFAVVGTLAQLTWWPDSEDSGGVWIFAALLACYSLGSHARGGVLALGALLPLVVVLAADLPTASGWSLISGVLFVTVFVGVLPTLVGRLVGLRRARLRVLDEQRELIEAEQRTRREAAVLAERLRATERLRPTLVDGLRQLAGQAERGADPGIIEGAARALLARTREEVVALTAPPVTGHQPEPRPVVDPLQGLRVSAQRWTVLGAGTIAGVLALEATYAGQPATSVGIAVLAGLAVALPFGFLAWHPLPSVALVWAAAAAYSHDVMSLGGTISEATLALSTSFAVALLSRRPAAVLGLALCLLGRAGLGAGDLLGSALLMVLGWLGGLAVQEATRLVEQGRANNRLLAEQEAELAQRAIVDERFRIAREVHDQIGHSLTVVALQAGAARRVALAEPDRAGELLATIAAAAREGVAAVDSVDPGSDLTTLLDHTRAAGLEVLADAETIAELEHLDPSERPVAFRIVQEALTNVLRHAPGAVATVSLEHRGSGLVVHVTNSPPTGAGTGSGTGRGLAGLRERVEAVGGTLTWADRDDRGFDVRAVLPGALTEAGR